MKRREAAGRQGKIRTGVRNISLGSETKPWKFLYHWKKKKDIARQESRI